LPIPGLSSSATPWVVAGAAAIGVGVAGYLVYDHFFDFDPKDTGPVPDAIPNGPIVGGQPSYGRDRGKDLVGIDLQAGPQVAYSVPVEQLRAGEQLRSSMQLAVTNDVVSEEAAPGAIDWNGEHRYEVDAEARVIFADSPLATTGVELSRGTPFAVDPDTHHALDTQTAAYDVPRSLDGRSGYVNVVVDANVAGGVGPSETYTPERENMVDLGGRPLLTVDQGHGGIDLVRLPAAASTAQVAHSATGPVSTTSSVGGPSIVSGDHPKLVALSMPLGALSRNEILEAQASVGVSNLAALPTLAKGELVLGDSPTDTDGPEVAAGHGTNLAPGAQGQELRHVGAYRVKQSMDDAYLNYVVTSGYVGANSVDGGALQVLAGAGGIDLTRYSPGV